MHRNQPFGPMGDNHGYNGNDLFHWNANQNRMNSGPYRVNCGELRRQHIGMVVEMSGKVHKISRERFIQVKDQFGITQLVITTDRVDLQRRFAKIPVQSYVVVIGEVQGRPGRGQNEKLQTGEIEMLVHDILSVKINKMDRTNTAPQTQFVGEAPSESNPPKITSQEYYKFFSSGLLQALNERKYTCADLPFLFHKQVTLVCWVERATKRFIFLMDGYGKIQAIVPSNKPDIVAMVDKVKKDDIITVTGQVTYRPQAQINTTSTNGHIELLIENITWPAPSDTLSTDNKEMNIDEEVSSTSQFSLRSHTCGELRVSHVGQRVTLCGWLHFQRLAKFVILRDSYGKTQCILPEEGVEINIRDIPLESILKVEGMVMGRPPSMDNEDMITGEVEVLVEDIEVLNESVKPKLVLADTESFNCEKTRLAHRYVDLRTAKMQGNLRLRSKLLQNLRNLLIDNYSFVEVETPVLYGNTIEDSKGFLVQTEQFGLFYSLIQNLQVVNQMLMAGGMDRYFQISKCFREEIVFPNRQPEFTQLNIELSFTTQEGIFELVEQILNRVFPKALPAPPFQRITYEDALEMYGSASPDITFELKLHNVTEQLPSPDSEADYAAYAIKYVRTTGEICTKTFQEIKKIETQFMNVTVVCEMRKLGTEAQKSLNQLLSLTDNNQCLVVFGDKESARLCIGEIRVVLGNYLKEKKMLDVGTVKPVWIIEQPLFVKSIGGNIKFGRHPFSLVHADDQTQLENDCLSVRCMSYDLVINGEKYGGGAVRAHDVQMVSDQLEAINMTEPDLSYFKKVLSSGCPPHAGIALGVDRLVALACDESSIRDVMAFPKSAGGKDLVIGVPFLAQGCSRESEEEPCEPSAKIKRKV